MQMKPSVYGKGMKNKVIQSAIINGLVIQEKMQSKVCDCVYTVTIHLTQQITQPLINQDNGCWLQYQQIQLPIFYPNNPQGFIPEVLIQPCITLHLLPVSENKRPETVIPDEIEIFPLSFIFATKGIKSLSHFCHCKQIHNKYTVVINSNSQ